MTGTAYVIDQLGTALEASHRLIDQQAAELESYRTLAADQARQIEALSAAQTAFQPPTT